MQPKEAAAEAAIAAVTTTTTMTDEAVGAAVAVAIGAKAIKTSGATTTIGARKLARDLSSSLRHALMSTLAASWTHSARKAAVVKT